MVGIVVVAHGELAVGLVSAVDMIFGENKQLVALSLTPEMDPINLEVEITNAVKKAVDESNEVLIYTDLFGATPFNASGAAWNKLKDKYNIRIISGVNLPMLLEILPMREHTGIDELYKQSIQAGKDGIKELRDEFYGD